MIHGTHFPGESPGRGPVMPVASKQDQKHRREFQEGGGTIIPACEVGPHILCYFPSGGLKRPIRKSSDGHVDLLALHWQQTGDSRQAPLHTSNTRQARRGRRRTVRHSLTLHSRHRGEDGEATKPKPTIQDTNLKSLDL